MTYRDVQEELRPLGIVMSKPGGRFRINFFGGEAGTAYFADTLDEALSQGKQMAASDANPRRARLLSTR